MHKLNTGRYLPHGIMEETNFGTRCFWVQILFCHLVAMWPWTN